MDALFRRIAPAGGKSADAKQQTLDPSRAVALK